LGGGADERSREELELWFEQRADVSELKARASSGVKGARGGEKDRKKKKFHEKAGRVRKGGGEKSHTRSRNVREKT